MEQSNHMFNRGMFISINNHKSGTDDIASKLRKVYHSIIYGLTGKNISKETIRWVSRMPKRSKVMDMLHRKGVIMVAAIHNYSYYNTKTGRGSRWNANYQHLHLFLYGIDKHMPDDVVGIENKVMHLKKLCSRYNQNIDKKGWEGIDIRPVGRGQYKYNDLIKPTTLYDYLNLPKTNPSKQCIINYMADTSFYDNNNYPLTFIYQEVL